jgi:dTDP-4-amino-4,6-dideoxygalactose transaminase
MPTTTKMTVPLLDLNAQYAPIEDQILATITDVFKSKQFILGSKVSELESSISDYCKVPHSIGVSSGTDGLILALMALHIGHGDEVIIPPFTFFATAGCVSRVGATPVFVDICPDTFNIDPAKIEAAITPKTKAIMPVHLFGQMADMDPILEIAKKHKLYVIEDASQAIGCHYQSKSSPNPVWAGAAGDIGCFSFFPSKNLGCMGDGGMVTTTHADLAEKMILLRNHGAKERYFHDEVGGNFRLDALQAAVLSVKLPYLEDQHLKRQENGAYYSQHLLASKFGLPKTQPGFRMIFNQYTIRSDKRDALQAHLNAHNIGNAVYYPLPLHLQTCFAHLGYKVGDFPESEKAAKEVLSIPIYAELTQEQKAKVVEVMNRF